MSTPREQIRQRLRETIRRFGVRRLASATGLSPGTLSQYLSDAPGRSSLPGPEALARIAAATGVSLSWLLGEETVETPVVSVPDERRLCLAIEAVEQGLEELRLRMSPAGKAQLVVEAYRLFAAKSPPKRATVLRLIKRAV